MKKWNDYKWGICAFLIVFVSKCILAGFTYPIRTLSDELATISAGAYFAGIDWSAVVSKAGYYGTGFSILFAAFFKITDNPFIIYRCILVLYSIIQSVSAIIAYYIMKKYYKIESEKFLFITSIAAGFCVATRTTIAYNEHVLIAISWIVLLIFYKLWENNENQKKMIGYTLLLVAVLGYSLTIHTRALILICAVLLTVLIAWIVYRKWLIHIPVFIGTGAGAYFLSKIYISYVQKKIWIPNEGEVIRNTTVTFVDKIQLLMKAKNWQSWLNIVIGQINTATTFLGGIFIISICVFCFLSKKMLLNLKQKERAHKIDITYVMLLCFVMCIAATILSQSVTWLDNAVAAMNAIDNPNHYGSKAFTYIRYFAPYLGPVVLLTIIYMEKNMEKIGGIVEKVFLFFSLVSIYWIICIVPIFLNTTQKGTIEVYMPFIFGKMPEKTRLLMFLIASVATFLMLLVWYNSIKRKKLLIYVGTVTALLVFVYFYNGVRFDIYQQKNSYEEANAGYKVIKLIGEELVQEEAIYVEDVRNIVDQQNFYEYQFLLNRYKIVPVENKKQKSRNIIFTNASMNSKHIRKWKKKGYKVIDLKDDNEILLISKQYYEKLPNKVKQKLKKLKGSGL